MALTLHTAEGGTPTDAVSTENSGGASGTAWSNVVPGSGGAITYTADAYYRGKAAVSIAPASGVQGYVERSITSARSGALTMWVKWTALPASGQVFLAARTGGSIVAAVAADNTGALTAIDTTGTVVGWSASGMWTAGVWYRLEWAWSNPTTSTGTNLVTLYEGNNTSGTVVVNETTLNNGTSNASVLRIGKLSTSGAFGPMIIDDIAYDTGTTTPPTVELPNPDDHYVAVRGRLSNVTGASTSVVDLPDGDEITQFNYLVARIAVDNSGTNGAEPGITSITDDASNTWTVIGPANQDPGAANAGVTCYLAYAKVVNAYSNGHDITITWTTGSPAAKAIVVEEWTNIDITAPTVDDDTATGSGTSVAVGAAPTASGQLVLIAAAVEGPAGDSFTLDSDTTAGTWRALESLSTDTATAASNVTVRGACKRVSGTDAQTYNSTITSRDWAAVSVTFDVPAPPAEPTPLETPVLTVFVQSNARFASLTWGPIENAAGYSVDVDVLDLDGDPDEPSDWSPLIVASETTELGLTLQNDPDGIDWGRTYRARVTALAELSE